MIIAGLWMSTVCTINLSRYDRYSVKRDITWPLCRHGAHSEVLIFCWFDHWIDAHILIACLQSWSWGFLQKEHTISSPKLFCTPFCLHSTQTGPNPRKRSPNENSDRKYERLEQSCTVVTIGTKVCKPLISWAGVWRWFMQWVQSQNVNRPSVDFRRFHWGKGQVIFWQHQNRLHFRSKPSKCAVKLHVCKRSEILINYWSINIVRDSRSGQKYENSTHVCRPC